jgi:3-hydroxyacyl-[acyl-carrier-protein] dehydratase
MSAASLSFEQSMVRRILPHRFSMLLLDRVESYIPAKRTIIGCKRVSLSDPLVQGYLPAYPTFPPVLVIEALAQLCGFMMNLEYLSRHGIDLARLGQPDDWQGGLPAIPHSVLADSNIRQYSLVEPGLTLRLAATVALQRNEIYIFKAHASVEANAVGDGDIMLAYPAYTSHAAQPVA